MRGIARTAVIAGTATATSNAVNRHQASKNAAAYNQAEAQYQQPAPAPAPVYAAPAPAAAPVDPNDKMEALERLGALKAQGILTEEEFAQQKAQILAS
jgi:3-oxoacyl-ACP reductase-like protein